MFENFFKNFGKAITHIQNDMYFQIKSEIPPVHTGYVTNMTPGSTCQILSIWKWQAFECKWEIHTCNQDCYIYKMNLTYWKLWK